LDIEQDGFIVDIPAGAWLMPGSQIKIGNKETIVKSMASRKGFIMLVNIPDIEQNMRGETVYVKEY
jgi:hypothetical protein